MRLLCTTCAAPLDASGGAVRCPGCGRALGEAGEVLDLLTDAERAHHAAFVRAYAERRAGEGRGWPDPAHYLALPEDGPGREWRLRTRTLAWLRAHLEREGLLGARRAAVLDAGAGCCWLTRHLAGWGLEAVALDLSADDRDGLGAGRHYLRHRPDRFWRVRAGFERLPFPAGSFDAVVFNGSLHYAEDPARALGEAARVLRPGGRVLALDSPLYRDRAAGERMAADLRPGERFGFLVEAELAALAARLGLALELERARRGLLGRAAERLTALRLGREPAEMSRAVLRPLTAAG